METSVDDALGMVSKWLNESTPLVLTVATSAVFFSLAGSIISIGSNSFVVGFRDSEQKVSSHATVKLEDMESIAYHESREIPPQLRDAIGDKVNAVMSMRYMGKQGHCCIYELTRPL